MKKVDATKLHTPDGKPTLFFYRHDTLEAMTTARFLNQDQPPPTKETMEQTVSEVLELSKSMSSSRGRTALDKNHKILQEGARVTAMWKGGSNWYVGHIDYVNEDGTVDIQYDDGDYEWYVRTEAYVKIAPSKKNGRTKQVIQTDDNVLLGGKEVHTLYKYVSTSVTSHLEHVPNDGEIRYDREHEQVETHFGGSDSSPPLTLVMTDEHQREIDAIVDSDLNLRSGIEANMRNGRMTELTLIEIERVLLKATASYEMGLKSASLYVRRRAHVSYSHMHDLLWSIDSIVSLDAWSNHDKKKKEKEERSADNGDDNDDDDDDDDDDDWSNAQRAVDRHQRLRRYHLLRAAELGSPEAQRQLAVDLLLPSPPPSTTTTTTRGKSRERPFGRLNTVPMEDTHAHPRLRAWSRRADAMLHLTFASVAEDPAALMTLGHQHYFHGYEKSDQTSYPWSSRGGEEESSSDDEDGSDEEGESSSMDEGGSFLPKSCPHSVHYYDRAAHHLEQRMMERGIHISNEPALLKVEEDDGIQGRR